MKCAHCGNVIQYSEYDGGFVCLEHGVLEDWEKESVLMINRARQENRYAN